MYYRVDRTYIMDTSGQSAKQADPPHFVSGGPAGSVARDFIDQESARPLGPVTELIGDKAMATAWREGRVFVVFSTAAERAAALRSSDGRRPVRALVGQ